MEWSTNEKVALDTAFAAAITGKRAACRMKQVGLYVAADSLVSATYTGALDSINAAVGAQRKSRFIGAYHMM